jgi:mRNA-degrading endonuclease RelE of RelBE toxin-antitoxin system
MQFSTLPEFDKEFKHLNRKYRSLEEDLDVIKSVLEKYPRGFEPRIFRISNLGISTEIYKVKHFHCKVMKNKGARSGIRIVYAYFPEQDKIEFVEIYYKEKDDRDCDRQRILKYYK